MKIFLDDDPIRDSWVDDTWTIVRTVREAKELFYANAGLVEELSLDHDLGEGPTGYDFIREIEQLVGTGSFALWCIPDKITIHSANPVGRKNMQAAIDSIERMRHG